MSDTRSRIPPPDNETGNWCVPAHFSPMPDLTDIPRGHRYNCCMRGSIVGKCKASLYDVYNSFNMPRPQNSGLYWMGDLEHNERRDTVKTMVLVLELTRENLRRWRQVDRAARRLLERWNLVDPHGVCVRYYLARDNVDVRLATLERAVYPNPPYCTYGEVQDHGNTPAPTVVDSLRMSIEALRNHSPMLRPPGRTGLRITGALSPTLPQPSVAGLAVPVGMQTPLPAPSAFNAPGTWDNNERSRDRDSEENWEGYD